MSRYYFVCHKCRKIVKNKLIEPMEEYEQYCPSCGNKTEIVVDHSKLGNIDMLFSSIGAELVYFSTGRIATTQDNKFEIDLPLLRFIDNDENFISKNLYLRNTRLSSTVDKIQDVFCYEAKTIFNTIVEAEKALNVYNTWLKISIDQVFHMLSIRNAPKSRYIHKTATLVPIRESDRKKAYYCPSCGNIGIISVSTNIGMHLIDEDIKFTKPVAVSEVCVHNNIRCIGCNDYMIEIDFDIADRIETMNSSGIETIYCCQGHINKETILDDSADRHRHQDISIDCPYITFYANKYENEGLIDIVYDIANNPKYTHLHIQFVDENHCETDDYDRIYVYGIVESADGKELKIVQSEFISFLDELIDGYKKLN